METKFKIGDVVGCISGSKHKKEVENWLLPDNIQKGDILTVSEITNEGRLVFEGHCLRHPHEKFKLLKTK